MGDGVVHVENAWKRFRLYHERHQTLKETVLSRRRARYEEFWALKGVDLEVMRGQTYGIVGENGSGKSTLLKSIGRILKLEKGRIGVNGRISALLELGAGFHPDLTGRENIYLNGAILQNSTKEIEAKFDEIVAFSELERFIDNPVRNYSSGMYLRLGFAVATSFNTDILLVDEILAVGDEHFQRKCLDRMYDLKNSGVAIIFVSHALETVQRFCDRAVWLDDGKVVRDGRAAEVLDAYVGEVYKREEKARHKQAARRPVNRWGTREVEIKKVSLTDGRGAESSSFRRGEPLSVSISYKMNRQVEGPVFGVAIFTQDGIYCYGSNTRADSMPTRRLGESGVISIRYPAVNLMPGSYVLDIGVYDNNAVHIYDFHSKSYGFKVQEHLGGDEGLFYLEHEWAIK